MIYLHSAGGKLLAAITFGSSCVQSRYLVPNGENVGIFKRASSSTPSDGSTYTCDGWCWLSFAICFGAILFLAVMTYRACCMSDPEDVQENNNVNSPNPLPDQQGGGVAPMASNPENQTVVTQPPAHQEMNPHQDESVYTPSYYDDPSITQPPAQQYPPAHQGGNPSSPSDVNSTPLNYQEVPTHQGAGNVTNPTMAPSNPTPPTVISKALGHQDVPAVSGSVVATSPKALTIITQPPAHQYPPAHQGGNAATSSSPTQAGTIITQPPSNQFLPAQQNGNATMRSNPPTVISQSPAHQYSPGAHQGGSATTALSPLTIMTPQSSAHQHSPDHQGGSPTCSSTSTDSSCKCQLCLRARAEGNYKISSASKQGGSATMTSNPYQDFFARQYASRAHQGGSATIPQNPPTVIPQQSPAHQYTSAQQGGSATIASNPVPYQGGQERMMPSPSSDIVQSSPYQYRPAHQGGMMPSPVSDIAYSPAHQYPSAHQGGSATVSTSPHQYPPSNQGGNVTMASNPPPITHAQQQHDDYPSLV